MQLQDISSTEARVVFTKRELITINNALNEVCNGVDIPQFSTRLGVEREEAQSFLQELAHLLDKMGP